MPVFEIGNPNKSATATHTHTHPDRGKKKEEEEEDNLKTPIDDDAELSPYTKSSQFFLVTLLTARRIKSKRSK